MSAAAGIFQKKALEKLSRPERTDQLFSIVPPIGWVALAAVVTVVFSAVIWSVFGIMADKVVGYGLLIEPAGAATISPTSGGRIKSISFDAGDRVEAGDIVAVIEQTQLEREFFSQYEAIQNAMSEMDLATRTAAISSLRDQIYRDGTLSSPYSGTIMNVRHRAGDIISAGEALYDVAVEETRQDLRAVIYLPALEGKKLKPGMTVQISPGAIDANEYGSLVGNVIDVSDYPVTSERVAYWTGNREFASWVVQRSGGAIVEAMVDLIKDEGTKSGYLWTTVRGPEEKIEAGMACTANAIVKRQAPIVKAFDKLSQWLRND